MDRIAVLKVWWRPDNDHAVETVSIVVTSADANQSKAAKLMFVKKDGIYESFYVAHAPGRYQLSWYVEGKDGAAIQLGVEDDSDNLLSLSAEQTRIVDGHPSFGFAKFRVKS